MNILVMPKAHRSLQQIVENEAIAGHALDKIKAIGHDFGQAIVHLHDAKEMAHGDIKPRNIVRTDDGDYKFIDLDATVKLNQGAPVTDRFSEGFMSPEYAKARFTAAETKSIEDLTIKKNAALSEDDLKRAKRLEKDIQILKDYKDSTLIEADASMDIWAFGVTMYFLYAGAPLFRLSTDKKDNLERREDLVHLRHWEGLQETHLLKILPNCTDRDLELKKSINNFLKKCLHKEKDKRFPTMRAALEHPLSRGDGSDEKYNTILTKMEQLFKDSLDTVADGLAQLNEKITKYHTATFNMLKILIKNDVAPKYMCIVPETQKDMKFLERLKSLAKPSNAFEVQAKVFFVCPITFEWRGDGISVTMTREWVKKYGPAIRMGLSCLQYACAVGRLAGLPIPNLSDATRALRGALKDTKFIKQFTESFDKVLSSVDEAGFPGIAEFSDTVSDRVDELNMAAKNLMKNEESSREEKLTTDEQHLKLIRASFEEVTSLLEDKKGVDIGLKLELSKKDGISEFVLDDQTVRGLFQEHGTECFSWDRDLFQTKLRDWNTARHTPTQQDEAIKTAQKDSKKNELLGESNGKEKQNDAMKKKVQKNRKKNEHDVADVRGRRGGNNEHQEEESQVWC